MNVTEVPVSITHQTIRPLNLNEVSPLYLEQLENIEEDVLRLDFPRDYSVRLGSLYRHSYVTPEGDTLVFSMFPLGDESVTLRTFLYKEGGFPKSTKLNENYDSQFFIIPRYITELTIGDEVELEFKEQYEDYERRVVCRKK